MTEKNQEKRSGGNGGHLKPGPERKRKGFNRVQHGKGKGLAGNENWDKVVQK